jgi:hypothetical protein
MITEVKVIPDEITNDYEAFLKVKAHLLTQKDKCIDAITHSCSYRGYLERDVDQVRSDVNEELLNEFGEDAFEFETMDEIERIREQLYHLVSIGEINYGQCAVGCLIKDDHYDQDYVEEKAVTDDSVIVALMESNPKWQIDDISINLLQNLQQVHDRINVASWRSYLNSIENMFQGKSKLISEFEVLKL